MDLVMPPQGEILTRKPSGRSHFKGGAFASAIAAWELADNTPRRAKIRRMRQTSGPLAIRYSLGCRPRTRCVSAGSSIFASGALLSDASHQGATGSGLSPTNRCVQPPPRVSNSPSACHPHARPGPSPSPRTFLTAWCGYRCVARCARRCTRVAPDQSTAEPAPPAPPPPSPLASFCRRRRRARCHPRCRVRRCPW